ncbi:Cation efflux protein [Corchorus olitorius]|uniref:Cation efflux protein n=1 Tax=Corchorus olitorius TaxID=93759 RepID=A0A1R3GJ28_9ROSI|nr:Cation efflux protein [Corchorus olitorius]
MADHHHHHHHHRPNRLSLPPRATPFTTNYPSITTPTPTPSKNRLSLQSSKFQALRYCGTAAMILAELSGDLAGRICSSEVKTPRKRADCFPLNKSGLSLYPKESCLRIWPMLLPFLSGFLSCYEKNSMNSGSIMQLGRKRVRLISLFFATVMLFVPAAVSFFVYESERGGESVSIENLGWPLVNTVVFGVLLSETCSDDIDKLSSSKDFPREFAVTFICTIILELFYFDELSLLGLLLCGLLLYLAVRELDPGYSSYIELGVEYSESFSTSIMKPIRHILSERKSRKIALFLLINTAYMVVEFVAGFMSNSLGLISDACHMLFDCAALAIGLYASYISRLPANNQFNYGRGRFEILSGYANAVFLVLVGALIVLESFERILDPQEVSTNSLLSVSIGGLLVNMGKQHNSNNCHSEDHKGNTECHDHNDHTHSLHSHTHCSESKGHKSLEHTGSEQSQLLSDGKEPKKHQHHHIDHNMQGIFLHVLADTLGSVGVVVSTLLIKYKGWVVADPACSIFISVMIISSVIPLLRNSGEILLQRIPRAHEQDLRKVIGDIMEMKGVCRIQNFRVWSFTNTDVVGTIHLHISAETDKASTKAQVSHILYDAGINDLTLQMECVEQ